MKTYDDALKYLNSFVNYELTGLDPAEKEFDLGKLQKALKKMGDPQRDYRPIHVAGTKGKGSICTFTSSILEEAGYRVGLFTSPHLGTVRERIKINSKDISKKDFTQVVDHLRKYLDSFSAEEFTFFEVCTLMAMLYFSIKKVDYAVFEVGMGGRLDATNVIDAEVCGISPISYDHTHVLGSRIEQIAREKAAIIKKGTRCVSSPQKNSALSVIKNKCSNENASLSLIGKDITYNVTHLDEKGSRFDIIGSKGRYDGCRTSMPGDFQAANCATAVGICEQLMGSKKISESKTKKGIARAFIPGRIEILSRQPLLVIDGAQNEESAMHLKSSVERIFRYNKLVLLLGISQDKDIKGVCRQLVPFADEIVLTRASVDRAADPNLIRGYIKGKPASVTKDIKEALGIAFNRANKDDMILATGSFFVIGEVRELILGRDKV